MKYYIYEIAGFKFTIAEEFNFITMVSLDNHLIGYEKCETKLIKKTKIELEEYFLGKRESFDIPLKFKGTDYQNKVWKEMTKILYGTVISYQELAKKCGNAKASRAVGNVCNRNNILILVPCHRVVSKHGLGGFGPGIEMKKKLLNLEKNIQNDCI